MSKLVMRYLPVFLLAVLSPFAAEILLGATPVSRVASLLPLTFLYGGGCVAIRELARRISPGWDRIVYLAAAYALVEEGMVMQTMFSPDLFNAAACGGRAFGVNWVWMEALAGYHIVWSIVIPIALVEICFPERRTQPWLGRAGITMALLCYLLGAAAIAITFRRFLTPHFRASAPLLLATGIVVANLVTWALRKPRRPVPEAAHEAVRAASRESAGAAVSPILAGVLALAAAGLWIQLFALPQPLRSGPLVLLPMLLAAGLAWVSVRCLQRWSSPGRNWSDLHRLALVAGALLASLIYGGVSVIRTGAPFDRGAQAFCGSATLVWLGIMAHRVRSTAAPASPAQPSQTIYHGTPR